MIVKAGKLLLHTITSHIDSSDDPNIIEYVKSFPQSVPLVIVTSKMDTIFTKCANNILDKLHEKNKQNLHHLVLHNSDHANMAMGDNDDQKMYIEYMEMLYDKYC